MTRSTKEIKEDIARLNQYHPWVGVFWIAVGIVWVLAYMTIEVMNVVPWLVAVGPVFSAVGLWYFFYARSAREPLAALKTELQNAIIAETVGSDLFDTPSATPSGGSHSAAREVIQTANGLPGAPAGDQTSLPTLDSPPGAMADMQAPLRTLDDPLMSLRDEPSIPTVAEALDQPFSDQGNSKQSGLLTPQDPQVQ
jgi:hypothetical protein